MAVSVRNRHRLAVHRIGCRPIDGMAWPSRSPAGWFLSGDEATSTYFLFVAEAPCCAGCLPGDPSTCIEVVTAHPVPASVRYADLTGTWQRLTDDSTGWRYRLAAATERPSPLRYRPVSRRDFLASAAAVALSACAASTTNGGRRQGRSGNRDSPAELARASSHHRHAQPLRPRHRGAEWRGRAAVPALCERDARRRHEHHLPRDRRRHLRHARDARSSHRGLPDA